VLSRRARLSAARAARHAADGFEAPARELEAFHRELIGAHLERELRAPRVIREITREGAR
jgi:hypothetical protein